MAQGDLDGCQVRDVALEWAVLRARFEMLLRVFAPPLLLEADRQWYRCDARLARAEEPMAWVRLMQ